MKASLGKLRRSALNKIDGRDREESLPAAQLDELAQAAKDMQDMRDCYDSLLSAAAATANSAYEFSESLREMGSFLLEKTSLHDDEESSAILLMLGNVQYELQKSVDHYRALIFQTITHPSESLLNELRTVEDMKRQCDEKRDVYEYICTTHREKGRSKGGKGESFTRQQLQAAHDEFKEDARLCIFRLKSLKEGQTRSLLTQAVRHHAAQLDLFYNGLKTLEAVDQRVKTVAELQHIDYQFSGIGNNGVGVENAVDGNIDGELSFDYIVDEQQGFHFSSGSKNSIEENMKKCDEPAVSSRDGRGGSHSAPLVLERRIDLAERARQLQPGASRATNTYALPVPTDSKSTSTLKPIIMASNAKPMNHNLRNLHDALHSPLDQSRNPKDPGEAQVQMGSKESYSVYISTPLPPPLVEGLQVPRSDASHAVDTQHYKRHSLSGPITSKHFTTKPAPPSEPFHGGLPRLPVPQPTSPCPSPPLVSSPKGNELHKLPRPPGSGPPMRAQFTGSAGHSAPLASWGQDHSVTNHSVTNRNNPFASTSTATPLPAPPGLVVPRSYSIPSRNQRAMAMQVSKLLESPQLSERSEGVSSPSLTPMSFSNIKSTLTLHEGRS